MCVRVTMLTDFIGAATSANNSDISQGLQRKQRQQRFACEWARGSNEPAGTVDLQTPPPGSLLVWMLARYANVCH